MQMSLYNQNNELVHTVDYDVMYDVTHATTEENR